MSTSHAIRRGSSCGTRLVESPRNPLASEDRPLGWIRFKASPVSFAALRLVFSPMGFFRKHPPGSLLGSPPAGRGRSASVRTAPSRFPSNAPRRASALGALRGRSGSNGCRVGAGKVARPECDSRIAVRPLVAVHGSPSFDARLAGEGVETMMKRLSGAAWLLVLAVPGLQAQSLADRFPADAIVYFQADTTRFVDGALGLDLVKLLDEPQVHDFLKPLGDAVPAIDAQGPAAIDRLGPVAPVRERQGRVRRSRLPRRPRRTGDRRLSRAALHRAHPQPPDRRRIALRRRRRAGGELRGRLRRRARRGRRLRRLLRRSPPPARPHRHDGRRRKRAGSPGTTRSESRSPATATRRGTRPCS